MIFICLKILCKYCTDVDMTIDMATHTDIFDCTHVAGDLTIQNSGPVSDVNLNDYFANLRSVEGSFFMENTNLRSFECKASNDSNLQIVFIL